VFSLFFTVFSLFFHGFWLLPSVSFFLRCMFFWPIVVHGRGWGGVVVEAVVLGAWMGAPGEKERER